MCDARDGGRGDYPNLFIVCEKEESVRGFLFLFKKAILSCIRMAFRMSVSFFFQIS